MSLSKLPTELDLKIISLLEGNNESLLALSSVSKSYYITTTSILYANIHLGKENKNPTRLQQLMRTILRRPSLARLIRSISWSTYRPGYKICLTPCDGLGPTRRSIRKFVSRFLGQATSSDLIQEWVSLFVIVERRVELSYTNCLALLEFLAANIRRVDIEGQFSGAITRDAILRLWSDGAKLTTELYHTVSPFTKVKRLSLVDCGTIDISCLPLLESLSACECTLEMSQDTSNLRFLKELRLRDINMSSTHVKDLIVSGTLKRLRCLSLVNYPDELRAYADLTKAICGYLPELEELEWWTQYDFLGTLQRGLHQLVNLKRLAMSFRLLFGTTNLEANFLLGKDYGAKLPPQLEGLKVIDLPTEIFAYALENTPSHASVQHAHNRSCILGVPNLTLILNQDHVELQEMDSVYAKQLSEMLSFELASVGVNLEVLKLSEFERVYMDGFTPYLLQ